MVEPRLKTLTETQLDALSAAARQSPRLRANYNLHADLNDPIQRLAIAMEPGTSIRPHRHAHTWEVLTALRGRFVVLYFDANGTVIQRSLLGEDCHVMEHPVGQLHAVLSLDAGGVIFEVKHGPYRPISEADYLPGFAGDDPADNAALNAWYARAQVGERLTTSALARY
jgi:cupin fold WbuC family metalloprotein